MTKPTNPNLSIPAGFAENGIKTNFTAEKIQTGFDSIEPDIASGDNLNKFLDDTYKGLTYATEGVQDIYREGIPHYDADETYPQNAIVKYVEDEQIVIYQSLVKDNRGNEVTNDNYWQLIKFSDNNSANTDLTNITDSAKTSLAGFSMPSARYVNLTYASGNVLTAPANGWATLIVQYNTGSYTSTQLYNKTAGNLGFQSMHITGESYIRFSIPVSIGDEFVGWNTPDSTPASVDFRFIYAQGAESEA